MRCPCLPGPIRLYTHGQMTLRIGQVATATGVSVRAIRHYDQVGLLASTRADNSYRVFQPEDIERVQLIQLFLGVGFTLEEIRRSAPCFGGGYVPQEAPVEEMIAFYGRKIQVLDAQLAALSRVRDRLASQVQDLEAGDVQP